MCLVLQSTAARRAFKYVQKGMLSYGSGEYAWSSIAISLQRYELFPESRCRKTGPGFPGIAPGLEKMNYGAGVAILKKKTKFV